MDRYVLKNNVKIIESNDGIVLIFNYGNKHFIESNLSYETIQKLFCILKSPRTMGEIETLLQEVKDHTIIYNFIESLITQNLLEIYIDQPDVEIYNKGLFNFFEYFNNSSSNLAYQNLSLVKNKNIHIIDMGNVGFYLAKNFSNLGSINVKYYNNNIVSEEDIINQPSLFNESSLGQYKIDSFKIKLRSVELCKQFNYSHENELVIICGSWYNINEFEDFNKIFLDKKEKFIPIIEDYFGGSIGPVIGISDGPCFKCLLSKKKSHLDYIEIHEKFEKYFAQNKNEITSGYELFTSQLANIATVELIKYITNIVSCKLNSGIYEYDLLNYRSEYHNIFQDINCNMCR